MPAKYWLDSKALLPGSIKTAQAVQLIKDLNYKVAIPAFTCTHPTWAGASMISARVKLDVGAPWAIRLPITQLSDCVLAIKWAVDDVVFRYKLWDSDNAVLNFPLYAGETIPANAILELWTVDDSDTVIVPDGFSVNATLRSSPTELYNQTAPTLYTATDVCCTYASPLPVTWEDYMAHCL